MNPDTAPSSVPAPKPRGAFRQHPLWLQSLGALVVIFVLAAINSPVRNGVNLFLTPNNQLNIVRFASENGIIAVGMTLVILTGGIDLSVGAVLALCSVTAAFAMVKLHWDTAATVALVLAAGTLAGTLNGVVTTRLRIQSFVTTLAMLSVARGAASLLSEGNAIPLAFGDGQAPASFKSLFAGSLPLLPGGIPAQIFYFLAIGGLVSWILQRTAFGRHVYAVGSNEAACRLSGLKVDRVKVLVFALSGTLVGIAALLHTALVNQGSHIDGAGYELNAIAAVVIGGTSLAGGTGTVLGSMVGALILSVLDNILGLRNIASEYQMILKGIIIVFAVVLQRARR